ncbi:MAG: SDR family NAD(P)-dependent oxidoreductase [Candidatus Omnitrophica bacterium]|nr:SDR family NAD(P)-dependent oxidoreductase [Candidatus Omnitrophota bacterium]
MRALITGASGCLGRELALTFAGNGFDLIVSDRQERSLKKVVDSVSALGVRCDLVAGDLKNVKTITNLAETARRKKIDVLINNAGILCPGLALEKITNKQVKDLIEVNLIGPILLTKEIYKYFRKKKSGTVININSMSGLKSHYLRSIYCASKWGLNGFSKSLQKESVDVRFLDIYPARISLSKKDKFASSPKVVAEKIFKVFADTKKNELIINQPKAGEK